MLPAPAVALVTVHTARIEQPGPLIELLPEHDAVAWVSDGEGLVGWGVAARAHFRGPDRFADAQAWWGRFVAAADVTDEVGLPGCGPVAFGSFAFDDADADSVLVVPEVVVGSSEGTWWQTTVRTADTGSPPALPPHPTGPARSPGTVRFADGTLTADQWAGVVAAAVQRIGTGEVDKVVLARDLEARTQGPLDVRWPLRRLAAGYPGCWTFAVDGLLGATPEVLVRLEKGVATSRVLAGTLRRSGDAAKDLRKGTALAGSIKDLEEHGYGVGSVVDALALHCATVDVPSAPFVLQLPNVMHLATDVSGVVNDGSTSLGLVGSLHPSAAVCGTPRATAARIIRETEGMNRGRYAGPVGWLDGSGDGEWGIALRCGALDPEDPSRLRLFAGCGIVEGSRPQDELAESVAKLVPMRNALQG